MFRSYTESTVRKLNNIHEGEPTIFFTKPVFGSSVVERIQVSTFLDKRTVPV